MTVKPSVCRSRLEHLVRLSCALALLVACSQKRAPTKASARSDSSTVEKSASGTIAEPSAPEPSAPEPSAPADAAGSTATAEVVRIDGPSLLNLVRRNGGHGTIVNVWASWCGPCRRELPMLRSLTDNLRTRGLSIVLVSVDEPEAEPELRRMLEAEGFSYPYYVAERPLGAFKRALHPTWPGVIPATFLFDQTGRRRYFWGGPVYEHELIPIAEGLVAGQNIDGEARFDLAPGENSGQ